MKYLSAVILVLMLLIFFSACKEAPPSATKLPPPTPTAAPFAPTSAPIPLKLLTDTQNEITPEKLVQIGKLVIFGTEDPLARLARGEGPIGKGQCPLCHPFFKEQKADRSPVLMGMEARSHLRIKEERYRMFVDRYPDGEPDTGIKPHAQTGGEYILESEYCPGCYIPIGYGIKGSDDLESSMPVITRHRIALTDFEIVAVLAYIQSQDTPGDYSKVTAVEDWEHYFGRELPIIPQDIHLAIRLQVPPSEKNPLTSEPPVALGTDTLEEIVQKMTCFACHRIPGISIAKRGAIGPLLFMKTSAIKRIKSPEYRKALKEGRAHATTPREYVIESITNPGAFIVPGFADDMPKDYGHKFTLNGLDKLVDYLMEQDEAAAIREGLDRLPKEKEGTLPRG